MSSSRLSDVKQGLLRRIAFTTRNVRKDIEEGTLVSMVHLCGLCSAPVDSKYSYCFRCKQATTYRSIVEGVVPLAFAPKDEQFYRDLVSYKRQPTKQTQAFQRLAILTFFGSRHIPCLEYVYGPINALGIIPSTQGRSKELLRMLASTFHRGLPQLDIQYVGSGTGKRRQPAIGDFQVRSDIQGQRILLFDDSWVTGAAVFSAASNLHAAGAAYVVAVVLGRVLDPAWGPNQIYFKEWQKLGISHTFDPNVCPVTKRPICPVGRL